MVIDSGHDQGHEDLPDVPTGNCDWGAGNGGCVDDDPAGWHGTGVAYNAMGPWVDIFGDFTIKPNQQDCVFSADVEGGYGSMSYKWYKNGDLDGTDDQYITSTGSSGSFELKLTVTDGQGVSKSRIRWVQIDSGGVECFF